MSDEKMQELANQIKYLINYYDEVVYTDFEADEGMIQHLAGGLAKVGELASGVSAETKEKYAMVPWAQLEGLRELSGRTVAKTEAFAIWKALKGGLTVVDEALKKW